MEEDSLRIRNFADSCDSRTVVRVDFGLSSRTTHAFRISSATNQLDDPPLPDEISIGRVADDESIIDEIETVTSSDVVLRNLSSVATITTHAASGGDADFPIEIDFERVGHTSIPRNQFLFVVSDGWIVASNNIGVKAQESFKVQKRVWWNGCLELLECPGLAES